jgi:hypothetical protein
MDITNFEYVINNVNEPGQLYVSGVYRAKKNGAGKTESVAFRLPATLTSSGNGKRSTVPGVCNILNLDVGEITLNLLGMKY